MHRLPLYFFLFLVTIIRIYLVIHGKGVIDGDEALVGIQAQHILQGEWHIYFYAIPYFGSLEAYFVAVVFALAGSSVWTLRIGPIVLSLMLVWLTWSLAQALARRAKLSPLAEKCFVWSATLVAACPPLYDAVIELRTWGGHIEIYVIMLLLLLSALSLVDRWEARASMRELGARWVLIGFLVGLGFWVYPLIAYAVAAAGIWIACGLVKIRPSLKELSITLTAIPSALLGFAPGIYWGATHQWANIVYILQQGSHEPLVERIRTTWHVAKLYRQCVAGRVIGGSVVTQSTLEHSIHTWLWYVGLFCFVVTMLIVVAAWTTRTPLLAKMSKAIGLPLLFGVCAIVIFCMSAAATIGLQYPCSYDFVSRYAAPVMLALPFFIAVIVTFFISLISSRLAQIGLALLLLVYVAANIYSYRLSDSGYLFQSPYCLHAPVDNDPLIAYLEKEHIRYAWSVGMVGHPIIFKTHGQVIAVNPTGIDNLNRFPAYNEAVRQSDRPSLITLTRRNVYPRMQRLLDREHITYRVARFPLPSGVDILVVTPLNHSVPSSKSPQEFGRLFVCL